MTAKASEAEAYCVRPEWQDVTPVPQADDGHVLVPILYTAEYKDAMGYFRAIIKSEEYSERVLTLTEHIIRLNPAHYSVWQYRYRTLLEIGSPLDKELALINSMMGQNLKTYQIWHHRRLLQTHLREPFDELAFISTTLRPHAKGAAKQTVCDNTKAEPNAEPPAAYEKPSVDTKNYHTWAYRQWLLAEFNSPELWAGELDFVDEMLRYDVRNNSAWHHRFFVVWESGVREGETDREAVLRRELDYTKEKISIAPNNASPWNYLRGILQKAQAPFAPLEVFITPYTIDQPAEATDAGAAEETLDLENPLPSKTAELPCSLAIEFLADIYIEKAATEESGSEHTEKAVKLFQSLATTHDTIRRKYWDYRMNRAKKTNAVNPAATAA